MPEVCTSIYTSVKGIIWDTFRAGLSFALMTQWRNTESLHTAKHTPTHAPGACTHIHKCMQMQNKCTCICRDIVNDQ